MNRVKIGPRTERQGDPEASQLSSRRLDEIRIYQREKDDPGRVFDFRDHAVELIGCSHQWIDMLDRCHPLVLGRGGARRRNQGLARRIGHEVKMEITAAQGSPLKRRIRRL